MKYLLLSTGVSFLKGNRAIDFSSFERSSLLLQLIIFNEIRMIITAILIYDIIFQAFDCLGMGVSFSDSIESKDSVFFTPLDVTS